MSKPTKPPPIPWKEAAERLGILATHADPRRSIWRAGRDGRLVTLKICGRLMVCPQSVDRHLGNQ